MKILFVLTFLSFLVLALALFQGMRHVRGQDAEVLEPIDFAALSAAEQATRHKRRAGSRKATRAVA